MDSYRLTKYERTHVIGLRAEQLARGAQAFVDVEATSSSTVDSDIFYNIAERELDQKKLPFIVVRQLVNGAQQKIRLAST